MYTLKDTMFNSNHIVWRCGVEAIMQTCDKFFLQHIKNEQEYTVNIKLVRKQLQNSCYCDLHTPRLTATNSIHHFNLVYCIGEFEL